MQTIGSAARNSEGRVLMYADTITRSMQIAISETNRRREIQDAYNKEHGIIPKTIVKEIRDVISNEDRSESPETAQKDAESMTRKELEEAIARKTKKMNQAAAELNFELAAVLRDELKELKITLRDLDD